jgi:tRNA(Ile)-lysidine synthase
LGIDEVIIKKVSVGKKGGLEAAAREARYTALETLRLKTKSNFIVLGHTSSDQAETVLLGLVRGSGAKSLSGMAPKQSIYCAHFLALSAKPPKSFVGTVE